MKQNWFADNFVAVPCGVFGNCSACVFRNTPLYCTKMSCTYFDEKSDVIESVYWCAKRTCANVALWPELVKWFNTTSSHKIMDISKDVMTMAILSKTR